MKLQSSILSIAIVSAGLTACGGSSSSNNTPVQSPIADLNIQCVNIEQASTTGDTETLELSIVGSYFSGSEFATSSAEIVSYDQCSDRLYVVNSQAASIDVLALSSDSSAPDKVGNIGHNNGDNKYVKREMLRKSLDMVLTCTKRVLSTNLNTNWHISAPSSMLNSIISSLDNNVYKSLGLMLHKDLINTKKTKLLSHFE